MFKGLVLAVATLWAGAAFAADQPQYAPPPAWVKPTPIPADDPQAGGAAIQMRLQDQQMRFADDGDQYYDETAYKILSAQGLPFAGNAILVWTPDTETLIIHRLHIIRDGQVIDALAGGKTFTVLRREKNLEMASLDGSLTANFQLEGLQVGDVVDLAVTRVRNDPVLQGHSESFTAMSRPGVVGRFHVRAVWPAAKPMRWRATTGLDQPTVTHGPEGGELTLDEIDAEAPHAPTEAPARLTNDLAQLETSQFADWGEVSALMAPLYQKAVTLPADSPLRAEVARIKAASADPKTRAEAALRLVQDQIRYVFLGMNNGGYIPAAADLTWARRYGDCKGKTALLTALLHLLDIDARPALVSTEVGDGLDQRLPLVEAFDHVMVRAVIGGKTYWLDGTRQGDHDLDLIPVPDFHWALPVQAHGAILEPLKPAPFDQPHFDSQMDIDATAGADAAAKVHAEERFRGDEAIGMNLRFSSLDAAEADRQLREYWRGEISWANPQAVRFSYDDAHQVMTLNFDGAGVLDWTQQGMRRNFDLGDSSLGYNPSFKREPGPRQAAPFALDYPMFKRWRDTIVLPRTGQVFALANDQAVDQILAGVEYKRQAYVSDRVVHMEATERSTADEVSNAQALADEAALRQLAAYDVNLITFEAAPAAASPGLQAPLTKLPGTPPRPRDAAPKPIDAAGFSRLGAYDLRHGDYAGALDAYDQAAQMEPQLAKHRYNHGVAQYELGHLDLALADFEQALRLDPQDWDAMVGRGRVRLQRGDGRGALADFEQGWRASDRAAGRWIFTAFDAARDFKDEIAWIDARLADDKDPAARAEWLNDRGYARAQWNHGLDQALADCDAAIAQAPQNSNFLDSRGLVKLRRGDLAGAVTDYDAALKLRPKLAASLFGRALAEQRLGDKAAASADLAAAKTANPKIEATFAAMGMTS